MFPKDFAEVFLEKQLYDPVSFNVDEIPVVASLLGDAIQLDTYCVECGKSSTFHSAGVSIPTSSSWELDFKLWRDQPAMSRIFKCARFNSHTLVFVFIIADYTLTKIGQHPSTADITAAEIKKYQSLMGNDNFREFNKAIGLASHGIGIGSFVYLRRIFEDLIEEAHAKAKVKVGWNEQSYFKARIAERIDILQNDLPSFLVENKGMYSILSKGIHELSENECLEMFPGLKLGIELILDEKLTQKERQNKITSATKNISKLFQKIKE